METLATCIRATFIKGTTEMITPDGNEMTRI